MKFISAVDAGAQGPIANVALVKRAPSGDEYSLTAKVAKLDESLGVVFGYAVASTVDGGRSPHIDLQGDAVVGGDELIKVALGFAEAGAQSDVMHDCIKDGWVPFVMPLNAETKRAFQLTGDVEGIAIGMKPSTETFKRFQSGELAAFSIYGTGERSPLEKSVITVPVHLDTAQADAADGEAFLAALSSGILLGKTQAIEAALGKSTPDTRVPDVGIMETKIIVLTEAQHAHYAKLSPADGEAFLAKSSEDRAALIAEIEKSNAVEYTAEDGAIYRKSDDPRLVDMAKRMDESIRIAKAESAAREAAQAQVEIEKRAEAVFGKVAGERSLHAKILKAVDALGDEAVQALRSMATLANERMTSLEVVAGIKPDAEVAASDNPQAEYDGLVADALKSFGGDRFKAAASVLKTARGAQLYTEIQKRAKARK